MSELMLRRLGQIITRLAAKPCERTCVRPCDDDPPEVRCIPCMARCLTAPPRLVRRQLPDGRVGPWEQE